MQENENKPRFIQISQPRDFTRYYDKASFRISKPPTSWKPEPRQLWSRQWNKMHRSMITSFQLLILENYFNVVCGFRWLMGLLFSWVTLYVDFIYKISCWHEAIDQPYQTNLPVKPSCQIHYACQILTELAHNYHLICKITLPCSVSTLASDWIMIMGDKQLCYVW